MPSGPQPDRALRDEELATTTDYLSRCIDAAVAIWLRLAVVGPDVRRRRADVADGRRRARADHGPRPAGGPPARSRRYAGEQGITPRHRAAQPLRDECLQHDRRRLLDLIDGARRSRVGRPEPRRLPHEHRGEGSAAAIRSAGDRLVHLQVCRQRPRHPGRGSPRLDRASETLSRRSTTAECSASSRSPPTTRPSRPRPRSGVRSHRIAGRCSPPTACAFLQQWLRELVSRTSQPIAAVTGLSSSHEVAEFSCVLTSSQPQAGIPFVLDALDRTRRRLLLREGRRTAIRLLQPSVRGSSCGFEHDRADRAA